MKNHHHFAGLLALLSLLIAARQSFAQTPGNDLVANAVVLTPSTVCGPGSQATSQTITGASYTSGANSGTCTNVNARDVWYKFVATNSTHIITLSNLGSSWGTSARIQLLTNSNTDGSGTWANFTCVNANTLEATGLAVGTTYFIRIHRNSITNATGTNWGFDICLSQPPANDLAANAVVLTPSLTCGSTSQAIGQTITNATYTSGATTGTCTNANARDVWYKFVATSNTHEITLSNLGSSWGTSARIQLLTNSNADGSGTWTNVACTSGANPTLTAGGLTAGTTYFIRIHRNNTATNTGANWGFDICLKIATVSAGRMKEVFKYEILSAANVMNNPWEVTYGPDNKLWVTESKNYKVQKFDPVTGAKITVLDISSGASGYLSAAEHTTFNGLASSQNPWPQGGFAGLALHPKFLDPVDPHNYVYISYTHNYNGSGASGSGIGASFTNWLVRFTYNTSTNRLESPVALCDTFPGSNDHNSQRIIIAPIVPNGTPYLFYASGDMGAGQGNNFNRPIKAQNPDSYEGKILRFNLEPDTDPGTLDKWIPNDNPYNALLGTQSAVWAIGMRNNQGFAYDSTTNILYGTSHGPYSDDELNIIEGFKNYGHPLVIGFYSDGNYNGTTTPISSTSYSAGSPYGTYGGISANGVSTCPPIGNETTRRNEINAMGYGEYKDPLFSAYPTNIGGQPNVNTIWSQTPNTPGNNLWPSEGWSGLGLYTKTYIPGWKRSLLAAGLKWGRLLRLKLGTDGITTLPSNLSINNTGDTITYLQSSNRYRDMAFSPDGKEIYIVMDNSASSVATDGNPPVAPACQGCLVKYTFLGYADNAGKSSIPTSIPVTTDVTGTVINSTTVVVNDDNKNLWVPITGPDGNILAEIFPNGNNLGTVTSAFYINSGNIRKDAAGHRLLDRNITITPQTQPSASLPYKIRLYLTNEEYTALFNAGGFTGLGDLRIFKNDDPCSPNLINPVTTDNIITPAYAENFGSGGKMVQAEGLTHFSSFYISSIAPPTLPLTLLNFTGKLDNSATLLQWTTENEVNTSQFVVERSTDAHNFSRIGTVAASGNSSSTVNYKFTDYDVMKQSSSTVYYRLKMVDKDDKYKYSDVVKITLPFITGRVNLFPNPANEEVNVVINAATDGKAQWKLLDNTGRVIMQSKELLRKGSNSFSISISKLSSGVYYFVISGAGVDQQVKLQKL